MYMKLLAIETATLTASVAVVTPDGPLAQRERAVDTHSDVLLSLIDDTLRAAGVSIAEIEGVAVGAGPGSFTGLRIGMATAKGICFARQVPLWAVSSLAVLAQEAATDVPTVVIPVLDARRGELFAGCYQVSYTTTPKACQPERALAPEQLHGYLEGVAEQSEIILVGNAFEVYPRHLEKIPHARPDVRKTPSASTLAEIALASPKQADLAAATPTYVRLSDAELKGGTRAS
jgi:tRNA threonylcarbamoyladenosine biosynthesis protein TsaB